MRICRLTAQQVNRLALLAVSPEWLTFTALSIGGVAFIESLGLSDGEGVVFVNAGEISVSSRD